MRLVRTQKFFTFILAVLLTSALIGMPLIEAQNLKPSPTNQLQVKGASSSTVGESRYYEASDNGTNYVGFKAPTSLAGNATWILPNADSSGVFQSDGAGNITIGTAGVTSVGLSMPSRFSVANSPVTSSGTLTVTDNGPDPSVVYISDEFVSAGGTNGVIGNLGWGLQNISGTGNCQSSGANYPNLGLTALNSGSSSGNGSEINTSANGNLGNLSLNGNWISYFVFSIASTSTISFNIGFRNVSGDASPAVNPQGIYVRYDTNLSDTMFTFVTKDGSGTNAVTTNSINADTNFHKIRIRSTSAGTIGFSIDGGTEYTTSSHVASGLYNAIMNVTTRTGSGATCKIDYFSFYTPTAAR